METPGPNDTRKAIRQAIEASPEGLSAKELIDLSIKNEWTPVVDPIDYAAESLVAAGLASLGPDGLVRPT